MELILAVVVLILTAMCVGLAIMLYMRTSADNVWSVEGYEENAREGNSGGTEGAWNISTGEDNEWKT